MVIISAKEKYCGWKMPWRAMSIIPLDRDAPRKTPMEAMMMRLGGLGTYRGVEKVYSVVAHADNNVRNGEAEKENDDSYIQKLHNCV